MTCLSSTGGSPIVGCLFVSLGVCLIALFLFIIDRSSSTGCSIISVAKFLMDFPSSSEDSDYVVPSDDAYADPLADPLGE
jgi:hypothetical protein